MKQVFASLRSKFGFWEVLSVLPLVCCAPKPPWHCIQLWNIWQHLVAVWVPSVGLLGFAQHKEFLVAFNTLNPGNSLSPLAGNGRSQRREAEILECFASSLAHFCFRALQNLVCDEHGGAQEHRNSGNRGGFVCGMSPAR